MSIELNNDNFASFIREAGEEIVVIDFWAAWCRPCSQFSPIFSEVTDHFKTSGKVRFAKVNVDEIDSEVLEKHNIKGIPCVIILTSDDLEVTRMVGASNKDDLISKIEKLIN